MATAGRSPSTPRGGRRFEVAAGGRRESIAGARAGRAGRAGPGSRRRSSPATGSIAISHSRRRGRRLATVEELRAPAVAARAGPGEGRCCSAPSGAATGRAALAPRRQARPPHGGKRAGRAETVAAWELGEGRGRRVVDAGPHGLHGRVRQRSAARGHRSQLERRRPRLAPCARAIRGDALPFRRGRRPRLAAELRGRAARLAPGGVYAIELSDGECEDLIPVAVRRAPDAEPAAVAVLLPTFTYLAYSCERAAPRLAGTDGPEDSLGRAARAAQPL